MSNEPKQYWIVDIPTNIVGVAWRSHEDLSHYSREVIVHVIEFSAYESQAKQIEELQRNCISLFLHETRTSELGKEIADLKEQLREKTHPTFTKTIAGFHAEWVIAQNRLEHLEKENAELKAENERLATEFIKMGVEHPCYQTSKQFEAENKDLKEQLSLKTKQLEKCKEQRDAYANSYEAKPWLAIEVFETELTDIEGMK